MKKWPIVLSAGLLAASPAIAGEGCTQVFGAPRSSFVSADFSVRVLPGPADWKQVRKVDRAFRKASPLGAPRYECQADRCAISANFKGDESSLIFSEVAHDFLLICTIDSGPCDDCRSKTRASPVVQVYWEAGFLSYRAQYTDNPEYDVWVDMPVDHKYDSRGVAKQISKLIRLEASATMPRR